MISPAIENGNSKNPSSPVLAIKFTTIVTKRKNRPIALNGVGIHQSCDEEIGFWFIFPLNDYSTYRSTKIHLNPYMERV